MKKLTVLIALALIMSVFAVPAVAGPENNPKQICKWLEQNEPEAFEFLNTKPGACVSSVASVGVEALMQGAFPSNAAAVGNCKALEATFFLDPGEPNVGGPYPYQFYWFEGSNPDTYTAYNRAGCVRLLKAFHSGNFPA